MEDVNLVVVDEKDVTGALRACELGLFYIESHVRETLAAKVLGEQKIVEPAQPERNDTATHPQDAKVVQLSDPVVGPVEHERQNPPTAKAPAEPNDTARGHHPLIPPVAESKITVQASRDRFVPPAVVKGASPALLEVFPQTNSLRVCFRVVLPAMQTEKTTTMLVQMHWLLATDRRTPASTVHVRLVLDARSGDVLSADLFQLQPSPGLSAFKVDARRMDENGASGAGTMQVSLHLPELEKRAWTWSGVCLCEVR